jgi:anti-sigma regulatory factor (Ser/Thr protein kinase)
MPPTVRAARTAAGPVITWARTFPAVPAQVAEARRFLAGLLDGDPAAGDAVLCLSELATNAIVHSRSREPGGSFTVRAQSGGRRLRVEVTDQGGPWPTGTPTHPNPADEPTSTCTHSSPDEPTETPSGPSLDEATGRGLLIVSQLATHWGRAGHSHTGWTIWYELDLDTGP